MLMTKANGHKRKADERPLEPLQDSTCSGGESSEVDVEEQVEQAIAQVKAGSHAHLLRRAQALQGEKDKLLSAADRHRKQQIKNINQLYEYELEDAQALYQRAYSDLQEQMVAELLQEKARLKSLRAGCRAALRSQAEDPATAGTGTGVLVMPSSSSGSAKAAADKRRRTSSATTSVSAALDQLLPDTAVRADLLEIVRDLQTTAQAFEASKPLPAPTIALAADYTELLVGDAAYALGDAVTVFSSLSQESYCGVLAALSEGGVTLRTVAGPRIAFTLQQLQGGRVSLSNNTSSSSSSNREHQQQQRRDGCCV